MAAPAPRSEKKPAGVALAEASRAFLNIEEVRLSTADSGSSYFGRTAFRPKALSAVTAPFAGRIASVAVEPGQRVAAGATLFTFESADVLGVRAAADQARIKTRVAEETLARQNEMVKRGVGLEFERFDAEMKVREARSELARAERNAALAGNGDGTAVHVKAPAAGVVVSVKAAPGTTVQPGGDPLVEIGDPAGLWVVADVPEGEAPRLTKAKGATVEVTIAAVNLSLRGRIAGVAPRSDAETRRTPVYVELEKTPAEVRAGMLVRVSVAPEPDEALWLPVTAVLLKEGGKRVVYLEREGNFVAREVELGDERNGRVRVLKGLQPGERVVMRGALLVDREAEQLL